ncbi:hypothetical protein AR457_00235 [Streptomyces agglomeratus]|nr:hypothetical protein AR457_00235 [Streptomyces agglomeratus]
MTGAKARVAASGPKKLVSISRRTSATSPPISVAPVEMPALLISSVASDATRAASRIDASSVTSSRSGTTPGTSTVSGRRAAPYTFAPRSTSWAARCRPSPRLAPVTTATAFFSSMSAPGPGGGRRATHIN